jgi:hypothetical protein
MSRHLVLGLALEIADATWADSAAPESSSPPPPSPALVDRSALGLVDLDRLALALEQIHDRGLERADPIGQIRQRIRIEGL